MNAVEIEEAVSQLVAEPFDPAEFPYQFITAFGAKKTTVDRLRKGDSNQSNIGGVLQRNNIHIAVAPPGEVHDTLAALRTSPRTVSNKAKFILATDGDTVEAEDLVGGDVIACAYGELARYFAMFLPLAGISTVKEIKNNPVDIKATGRLNKLYVTLLTDNPDWATEERRPALNQFMARLIFCYFAEDTGIFNGEGLFTATVAKMSEAGHGTGDAQWGNTHEVLQHLFLAMDTPVKYAGNFDDRYRRAAGIRPYADVFPYVNGGLFAGAGACPRFSRTARAYLLSAGELDWKEINPDIFGSMIQAVADDGERGELGMHYTSVPNILKVLNPLFLDDLRGTLEAAGDSKQKLRNLRKRLSSIRVFDPACGSGNFLVIAYKEMRKIEAEIVARLGGEANLELDDRRSVIPLSNFYGIEIKGFAAEIARLALLIAEFQADCLYLSQQEARAMVLPLHKTGQIAVGNALRLDWLKVCPPARAVSGAEYDLGGPTGRLALDANGFGDRNDGEIYICGNPPYLGKGKKERWHQDDMEAVFAGRLEKWGYVDYVGTFLLLAADYVRTTSAQSALVMTNSIAQGRQLPQLWPAVLADGVDVAFAHLSFKWQNNASNNAGVTVVVVGLCGRPHSRNRIIYEEDHAKVVKHINAYLLEGDDIYVESRPRPVSAQLPILVTGSVPNDGGNLILSDTESAALLEAHPDTAPLLHPFMGSADFIQGLRRNCLIIRDADLPLVRRVARLAERVDNVRDLRLVSPKKEARDELSLIPHRFQHNAGSGKQSIIIVPSVSSESRLWFPVGYLPGGTVVSNLAFVMLDPPIWALSLAGSKMHQVWLATVCGKLETRYRYSNTLGWNTFPVPKLTEQDKIDLTRTAENILLAREAHFPATIADLYDPDEMPDDLRRAHEENDEVLERIYIGRRFRNDTERLEKLFEMYTKMTANAPQQKKGRKAA